MHIIHLNEQVLAELAADCDYNARRIAQRLNISSRHLQRVFKARMQATPGVWLREQRLQRARQMLAGACSVKRVAYSLGFQQASQFSRDFKARFGYPPSADLPDAARRSVMR
jgi:transcriptional regulator GlxA family with amidase domain